jgi:hypothetical protein
MKGYYVAEDDVLGFDVTVEDVVLVEVTHGLEDLAGEEGGGLLAEGVVVFELGV